MRPGHDDAAAVVEDVEARARADRRPLVVHVVYRFHIGGLENGVVNLINHMPENAFIHCVVALTEVTSFRERVRRADTSFIALGKGPGHAVSLYPGLYRLFRRLRPAVVHTRNLAALEAMLPAWFAGVPVRIHGEHGRDSDDPDGTNRRYQWLRCAYRPFVQHYVALSNELATYLERRVGVPAERVSQFYNGVDLSHFHPAPCGREVIAGCPFGSPAHWLIGTVGRMQTIKNQPLLARAFVHAIERQPALRRTLRLVMVGDGPLLAEVRAILASAGLVDCAWMPGERDDVAAILRGLDCFVLPSAAEGISNTILEAMACALPVVATAVGGNAELIVPGNTGELVPSGNVEAMSEALARLAGRPAYARALGRAGREQAERRFSLEAMVASYRGLYERLLAQHASAA